MGQVYVNVGVLFLVQVLRQSAVMELANVQKLVEIQGWDYARNMLNESVVYGRGTMRICLCCLVCFRKFTVIELNQLVFLFYDMIYDIISYHCIIRKTKNMNCLY